MTSPTGPEIVDLPTASATRRLRTHPDDAGRIVCEGLVRIYKVADLEVVALQGLDLVVRSGEMIAIALVFAMLMSIVGGLVPATRAARLVIVEALGERTL